jgi:hypothetical protein
VESVLECWGRLCRTMCPNKVDLEGVAVVGAVVPAAVELVPGSGVAPAGT